MKVRNTVIGDDSFEDEFDFSEQCECEYEIKEKKHFPIKKALVATVMAISLGIVINGASNINRTEIHGAIAIEDSIWSDFDCTKVNSYFDALSSGTNYKMLSPLCVGESTIYSSVQQSIDNMNNLYDKYDCYAQGIQRLGAYITVQKVNGVSDGTISLSINYVSEADVVEYFNANANDLNRYFTNHDISQESMTKVLFNLMNSYALDTSVCDIELPVQKVDGLYTIADDSAINDILSSTYNSMINEMVKQIKLHR